MWYPSLFRARLWDESLILLPIIEIRPRKAEL